ncbi:hypothetical protein [Sphingomonas sp. DT-51]|uniref:hypothetical protein n=1 Tax=Sphingomonas sp. DT-51 TaxID=3396165 RepID=UPI003F540373
MVALAGRVVTLGNVLPTDAVKVEKVEAQAHRSAIVVRRVTADQWVAVRARREC